MKKNMRKVPIIQFKSDIYHNKEVKNIEDILEKVDDINGDIVNVNKNDNNKVYKKNIRKSLAKQFKALFNK